MDWLDEVRARDKRGNQVLFAKDSAFLEDLRSMIASQSHRVLVLWALDCRRIRHAARIEVSQ